MRSNRRGLTLIEVVIASILGALLAGGTLMAFLLAVRTTRTSVRSVDATALVQQTIEKFRNKIACDETDPVGGGPGWFNPTCVAQTLSDITDPIPIDHPITAIDPVATRNYTVTPADCDGVGGPGDCLKVKVNVNWTETQ